MIPYQEFRDKASAGAISCSELVSVQLEKLEKSNLNSFITVCTNQALEKAAECNKFFREGKPRPLEGMIIAVKDNISTKNIRTTCGSAMLVDFLPVYDSTAVKRIRKAGGIIIGKTNMDEFALGSSNENSYFGPVDHPLDDKLVPGGSSGGSAAAVAGELVHAALGTDTGGSVRQPAAFCGIYGFKPTYGWISRYGLVSFASSFDQIGILSKNTDDSARIFDIISGADENDATCSGMKPAESFPANEIDLQSVSIAAVTPDSINAQPDIIENYNTCIGYLRRSGINLEFIKFPHLTDWISVYSIISNAELSSNLARFDGLRYGYQSDSENLLDSRTEAFGDEVKRRIIAGTYILSQGHYDKYYTQAQKARQKLINYYSDLFHKFDLLILPSTPETAFRKKAKSDPVQMYNSDIFTVTANLARIPAASVPSGLSENGLPIGLQLQAAEFRDEFLLRASKTLSALLKESS